MRRDGEYAGKKNNSDGDGCVVKEKERKTEVGWMDSIKHNLTEKGFSSEKFHFDFNCFINWKHSTILGNQSNWLNFMK